MLMGCAHEKTCGKEGKQPAQESCIGYWQIDVWIPLARTILESACYHSAVRVRRRSMHAGR